MSKEGSIITCQSCGEPLEANWAKCPVCLTPTSSGSLTCPNCQAAIKENWKLCPHCKTTLPGWETPPTHERPDIHKSADSDKDQIFVTIADNEPMATVGFGFDLPITKGDVLGDRYKIIQSLGAGGFGAVYQVEDLVLNEHMALKVVVTGEGKAQRASEQILHEFKLREKINDLSYIVKAQDPRPCEFKGLSLVLLPMEFADGRSMRHWLAQNLDIEKRQKQGLELFKQACLGVKAIHDAGLVHLDIKPENILLADGKAKIADFGIGRYGACQFSKNPDQLLRQGIGTPQYMSPEQFHVARQKDVGTASDIYSLGIVLFELLDGNLPFDGTPIELRDKHLKMPPPQLPEKLGRWLGIVKRCLEKKVEDRYHNIKQLIKDLERVVQGTAISTDVSCPQCGHINANPVARECDKCRTNLASLFRLCPVCDKSVRLDIETCTVCGKAVAAHYRLLDRKEHIEKLKDEDPVEAIELLETVLQQETEDYHERAIQLLKDLRKKQSQINSLTTQAYKAESACLPEKTIEIWHEILRIIPRHRIALEQVQKLELLMKDFRQRLEKTITLMDEAKFENADKLLQGCLELIPTRKDVKEMLETCRKRAQEYATTSQRALISQRKKLIQDADKQINKALLQAPRSDETLALADKIHEITEKTNKLLYQAKLHLTQAKFSAVDKTIAKIEEKQLDNSKVSGLKKKLAETRNTFSQLIKEAKSAISSHDLNNASKTIKKALELCPESPEAEALSQQINRALAESLIQETQSEIKAAKFEKAEDFLNQSSRLCAVAEGLDKARELLKNTKDAYNEHMRRFRTAKIDKDLKTALKEIEAAIEICPASEKAKELKRDVEILKKIRDKMKENIKKIILAITKWSFVLMPGVVGIIMLFYAQLEVGGITTGICILAGILHYIRKTKIYNAVYNWNFIKGRAKPILFLIGLLLAISGILSVITLLWIALVFSVIAVVCSFDKELERLAAIVVKWPVIRECKTEVDKVTAWWNSFSGRAKSVYAIISVLLVAIVSTTLIVGTHQLKQKRKLLMEISNASGSQTAGNWKEAAILYEKLLEKNPDDGSFKKSLTICRYMTEAKDADEEQKFDEALTHCQNARSLATVQGVITVIDSKIKELSADKQKHEKISSLLAEIKTLSDKGELDKAVGCITEISNLDLDHYTMYQLGVMYEKDEVVDKDDKKAAEWYNKATAAGNSDAMKNLGVMYCEGRGVSKDYTKAMELFHKAAAKGNTDAMCRLGQMYRYGKGVAKDDSKAVEWYHRAAEAGNRSAMFNLGWTYSYGKGVSKDYGKAIEWYQKAAEAGDRAAMHNLGSIYSNGEGVRRDYGKAIGWYNKASEAGDSYAMCKLAQIYEDGRGVIRNRQKAIEWYSKATKLGHKGAQQKLTELTEKNEQAKVFSTKVAESAKKVTQYRGSKKTSLSVGLIHYYPCEESTSERKLVDIVSGKNSSLMWGAPKIKRKGIKNYGWAFNGNDAIAWNDTLLPDLAAGDDFTLSIWAYNTGLSNNNDSIWSTYYTKGSKAYFLLDIYDGKLRFIGANMGFANNSQANLLRISSNQWYHYVLRKKGSSYTIFVNGTSVFYATGNSAVTWDKDKKRRFIIGSQNAATPGKYWWNGYFDEFGVWARSLSDTEVSKLYNSGNGLSYNQIVGAD